MILRAFDCTMSTLHGNGSLRVRDMLMLNNYTNEMHSITCLHADDVIQSAQKLVKLLVKLIIIIVV